MRTGRESGMEASYKRDKDHNYMILEAVGEIQGNEYQIRMILINKIPGLLECKMRLMDGKPLFYYEITSRQPVTRAFEKTMMGTEDIRHLLIGIRRGLEEARRYLLNVNNLILDPHYIYIEPESGEVSLCYLPFYKGVVMEGFRALTEYILKNLDHGDEEAVLWGYEIYSRAAGENYNLEEILQSVYKKNAKKARPSLQRNENDHNDKNLNEMSALNRGEDEEQNGKWRGRVGIEDEKEEPGTQENRQGAKDRGKQAKRIVAIGTAGACGAAILGAALLWTGLDWTQAGGVLFLLTGGIGCAMRRFKKRRIHSFLSGRVSVREADEDELIQWEEESGSLSQPLPRPDSYGETQAFTQEGLLSGAVLISMEPERWSDLNLSGERQIIGKLEERVDLVVAAPEVSRIHAQVQERENGYYLTDLNSKNGTFINGARLETNESRKLKEGDQIQLGIARYFFKERLAQREGIHYNEK